MICEIAFEILAFDCRVIKLEEKVRRRNGKVLDFSRL